MASNITYDKAYDAVDRDDFMKMIEVDRFGRSVGLGCDEDDPRPIALF